MEWYWWLSIGAIAIGMFVKWYAAKVRECARDDLPGEVFDAAEMIHEVSDGTLAGLPTDGRYYFIYFLQQCNRARWLGGGAVNRDDAVRLLDAMAADHGARPRNIRPSPLDPTAGHFTVKGRCHKHTVHLMVFSHHEIGAASAARNLARELGIEPPRI